MGFVRVEVRGSFRTHGQKTFSAMDHGHARAITDAIAHLVALLPDAIRQDHELHDAGERPARPFGKG